MCDHPSCGFGRHRSQSARRLRCAHRRAKRDQGGKADRTNAACDERSAFASKAALSGRAFRPRPGRPASDASRPRSCRTARPGAAGHQRTLGFAQEFDPHSSTIAFGIGLSEHPAFKLLPHIVDCLHRSAPSATLHVRSFTARDEAVSLLDTGEIDLAIGVPPPCALGRILTRPMFQERFVCIVRKSHPCVPRPLSLEAFLSLPHLLVSPDNASDMSTQHSPNAA